MSKTLLPAVNASEQAPDEPSFWFPDPNEPVDDDLETLYWRYLLIDDPITARAALARMAAAVLAWSAEVASWGTNEAPLWCPSCGEYRGGEPCTTPSCAERPPTPPPSQPPLPNPPPYPPGEEPGGPWPEPVMEVRKSDGELP